MEIMNVPASIGSSDSINTKTVVILLQTFLSGEMIEVTIWTVVTIVTVVTVVTKAI